MNENKKPQFIEKNLDSLLSFIERNIDLKHLQKVEKIHIDTLTFQTVPLLPLTVIPIIDQSLLFSYVEAFQDPYKMMYNELLQTCGGSVYSSVQTKDFFPLHIRSNHGIGIIPSLFGLSSKIIYNNMPWVEHFGSRDEVKRIIQKGIPNLNKGLVERVIQTHHFYLDKLKNYPLCSQGIKVSQPDMQGPFDIAHLMLGTDIFYLVYENPLLLHELLDLITETYIRLRKYIDKLLTDKTIGDAVYVHGAIYLGQVVIKDDTAVVNLSPEMYDEFSWQYNKKIFSEFKGSLHSCGKIKDWLYDIIDDDNLMSINYGNPEMQNFQNIYKRNKGNHMSIIGWGHNQDFFFLDEVFNNNIKTGLSLSCQVKNVNEGIKCVDKYKDKNHFELDKG
ncbi:MAG: hypothetical protein KBG67_05870 [Candidatus Atribacteria bacterium]|nr:hypothetical protein [Candidatus Atribacteria bacterium]